MPQSHSCPDTGPGSTIAIATSLRVPSIGSHTATLEKCQSQNRVGSRASAADMEAKAKSLAFMSSDDSQAARRSSAFGNGTLRCEEAASESRMFLTTRHSHS
eukprot:Amastigsp_a176908_10.p3 type:complete len:102 gc:universal Amastigsp_a176908_10:54-359(+)